MNPVFFFNCTKNVHDDSGLQLLNKYNDIVYRNKNLLSKCYYILQQS